MWKVLLVSLVILTGLVYQPVQARASGVLVVNKGPHERQGGYTEVVVSGGRYYYDQGVFYKGAPGHYIVTEAPVGAVVYNVPSGYERVDIEGAHYVRYRDVYYRPSGRGYEVVRINGPRDHRDNNGRHGER